MSSRSSKMPRPRKADALSHGEKKIPRQFMITPTSDNLIEEAVEITGLSRSEVLERAIKAGLMTLATEPESLKKFLLSQSKPPTAG